MIRYRLYEDGGHPVPMDDEEEILATKPLRPGASVQINEGRFKVLRVTREDIAIQFLNDDQIGAIAIVERK